MLQLALGVSELGYRKELGKTKNKRKAFSEFVHGKTNMNV
jgi:hypothetical protein